MDEELQNALILLYGLEIKTVKDMTIVFGSRSIILIGNINWTVPTNWSDFCIIVMTSFLNSWRCLCRRIWCGNSSNLSWQFISDHLFSSHLGANFNLLIWIWIMRIFLSSVTLILYTTSLTFSTTSYGPENSSLNFTSSHSTQNS